VREETGLEIELDALTGVYKNMRRGVVALVFRCQQAGGELATGAETTTNRWMTPHDVLSAMNKAYAVRLLDAFDAGPPHVRSHDGVWLLLSAGTGKLGRVGPMHC
jgi:8-oxo-dGTP diphosphatase